MGCPGGPLWQDVSGSISTTVLLLLFSWLGEHWEKTPLHVTEGTLQNFRARRDLRGHLVQSPVCPASFGGVPVNQNMDAPSRDGPFHL